MSTSDSDHLRDMAHSARAAIANLTTMPDRISMGAVDVWAIGRAREALTRDAERYERLMREALKEEQIGARV